MVTVIVSVLYLGTIDTYAHALPGYTSAEQTIIEAFHKQFD